MGDLSFSLKTKKFATHINIPIGLFGKYDAGNLMDFIPSGKNGEEKNDSKKSKKGIGAEEKFGLVSAMMLLTTITLSAINTK